MRRRQFLKLIGTTVTPCLVGLPKLEPEFRDGMDGEWHHFTAFVSNNGQDKCFLDGEQIEGAWFDDKHHELLHGSFYVKVCKTGRIESFWFRSRLNAK